MARQVRMVWITKAGLSTSYVYLMGDKQSIGELVETVGWSSGIGCALTSKETAAIILTLDDLGLDPPEPRGR